MKPLVLISGLGPGGAERVTVSLLKRLTRAGVPVMACTVTDRHDGPLAEELRAAGVDRRDLGARRLADGRAVLRLARLLQAERIDLVHAHGQDASIVAWWATSLRPTPMVVTRHVLDEPRDGWRLRARAALTLRAFRAADLAVAVSAAAARALAQASGLPLPSIRVVPNGVDIERFAAADPRQSRATLAGPLGLAPTDRVVLLPGVMRPGKGHDEMLDALPALLRRVPETRLLLAGSGCEEERLQLRAAGFGDRVLFLGHRDDMPRLMAASDVIVLPSRAEALPTVLMEAAAAERPVVASAVGGVPEVVEADGSGVLVPPGDAAALAAAVAGILADATRAGRLGRRAKELATQRFTVARQLGDTLEVWEDAVREARR